jgi:hypothetical protein
MKLYNFKRYYVFGLIGLLIISFLSQMFFYTREKLTTPEEAALGGCLSSSSNSISEMILCLQKQETAMKGSGKPVQEIQPVSPIGPPSSTLEQCYASMKNYGFRPKVTWGKTPPELQDPTCDDKLCSIFKQNVSMYTDIFGSSIDQALAHCKSKGRL